MLINRHKVKAKYGRASTKIVIVHLCYGLGWNWRIRQGIASKKWDRGEEHGRIRGIQGIFRFR
jgi:hypothetical protein